MTLCLLMPFAVPAIAAPAKPPKPKVAKRASRSVHFGHTVETATFTVGGKCRKGEESVGGVFKDKNRRLRGTPRASQHWEGGYSIRSAMSMAIARHRAIELANGGGIVEDDDPNDWHGVPHEHENDDRRDPIIWSSKGATVILKAADGYASYGRREFVGRQGVSTMIMDRAKALEHGYVPSDSFQNLGDSPFTSEYTTVFRSVPTGSSSSDANQTMGEGGIAASATPKGKALELWLADTGCGHDLVGSREARDAKLKLKVSDNPMRFQTANGETLGNMVAPIRLDEIDEVACPYVLHETPSVISIGKRTMNQGYSFIWSAGQSPYFITPRKKVIDLDVINDIPYIRRGSLLCQPRDAVKSDYYVRHGHGQAVPAAAPVAPVDTDGEGAGDSEAGGAADPPEPEVAGAPDPPPEEEGEGAADARVRRNLREEIQH